METRCPGSFEAAAKLCGWTPVSLCAWSGLSHHTVVLASQENQSASQQLTTFPCNVTSQNHDVKKKKKKVFIKVPHVPEMLVHATSLSRVVFVFQIKTN